MTESEIYAYAAGLIDGEGTITLNAHNKLLHRHPSISVSSTSYPLLEFMKLNFGGCINKKKTKLKSHYKDAYEWKAIYNSALDTLEKISPYLMEPEKKRRCDLLLTTYKKVTHRGGKYSDEMLLLKREFEIEFFKNSSKVKII